MTEPTSSESKDPVVPSRRERLRPLELVGFSGVLALFAGLVVLMATREIVLSSVAAGAAFIVTLVTVALIGLGGEPSDDDVTARKDLKHPGRDERPHH